MSNIKRYEPEYESPHFEEFIKLYMVEFPEAENVEEEALVAVDGWDSGNSPESVSFYVNKILAGISKGWPTVYHFKQEEQAKLEGTNE